MRQGNKRFAVGHRVRTIDLLSSFRDVEGRRCALAGKVTALDDDGDVQVAISAPRGWAGKTMTFSPDLIEHIDCRRGSRPGVWPTTSVASRLRDRTTRCFMGGGLGVGVAEVFHAVGFGTIDG